MLKPVIWAAVIIALGKSFAAETDTFTNRDLPLSDSAETINRIANDSLNESIQEANSRSFCNENILYKEMRKHFGNHTNSTFDEKFTRNLNPISREILHKDSVYQDWKPIDGVGMGLGISRVNRLTMSPVIRVGEILIGTDKLEHMYGQGFRYFERNYLRNKGITAAFKRGIISEKTILGGNKLGNGVFSYADLAANFNGMRFWNHVLQLREDILGSDKNLGPYVQCRDNQWQQVKKIDFRNYIDEAMDEAINCSKFPSAKTAKKFKSRLSKMEMRCPLDPQKLESMKLKYGSYAHWIINDKGPEELDYTGEFKKD